MSRSIVSATKIKFDVPTQLAILFQWQSKVIDLADPSIPSFLYSFYIELAGHLAVINQSFHLAIHTVFYVILAR